MISKSPERGTFHRDNLIRQAKEKGLDPETDANTLSMIDFYKSYKQLDEENINNPEWQKNNMEYDLRSTPWIIDKVRHSDTYAQNLYAAMCNTDFVKNDVWPILQGTAWYCSWRHAGGIIADMREKGDYIDWYCSGIGDGLGNGDLDGEKAYVNEGTITDEIRDDLLKLGWLVLNADN